MIDLYTWPTPNGRKISIMLEETGINYTVFPVNIGKDDQFQPNFLKISPNNKIPAIVDRENDNYSLFESGAILMYLADKSGMLINKSNSDEYFRTIEWVMWQMGGVGPMFGQVHHFVKYNKGKSNYAEERYSKEAKRLYKVMDDRLGKHQYISGNKYSIADISIWPWTARFDWQEIDINNYPNVSRWYKEMVDRPAVQKGWQVPQNDQVIPMP